MTITITTIAEQLKKVCEYRIARSTRILARIENKKTSIYENVNNRRAGSKQRHEEIIAYHTQYLRLIDIAIVEAPEWIASHTETEFFSVPSNDDEVLKEVEWIVPTKQVFSWEER